jgi:hypothetical protein
MTKLILPTAVIFKNRALIFNGFGPDSSGLPPPIFTGKTHLPHGVGIGVKMYRNRIKQSSGIWPQNAAETVH